jgi:hypothetical protein
MRARRCKHCAEYVRFVRAPVLWVMPAVLQQLMRHESVETTMRFYVGQNADATADAVWDAWGQLGATLGASSGQSGESGAEEKPQTLMD